MKTIMEQANEIFEMTGDLKDLLERVDKLNKEADIKKIDFESFLQEKFVEEEPQVLDDMIPDAFEDWMQDISIDEVIDYAQEYAEKIYKANLKG